MCLTRQTIAYLTVPNCSCTAIATVGPVLVRALLSCVTRLQLAVAPQIAVCLTPRGFPLVLGAYQRLNEGKAEPKATTAADQSPVLLAPCSPRHRVCTHLTSLSFAILSSVMSRTLCYVVFAAGDLPR